MAISSINSSNSFSFTASSEMSMSEKVKTVIGSDDAKLIEKAQNNELNSKDIITAYQMSYMAQSALQFAGDTKQPEESYDYKKIMGILEGIDANQIGYSGTALSQLSKKEAEELVSEDGFFGIKKTSQRLADFVINGAGDDLNRLQQGREGIIKGYKEAEAAWGGELPEISKKTLEKALEQIDKRIEELGGNVINAQA